MNLYEIFKQLGISYQEVSHSAVYTIEEADQLNIDLDGIECKNLFLKDKHHFYLYMLEEHKRADLKVLRNQIGSGPLSFVNEEYLMEKLSLIPGSVTPLGIINNISHDVIILLDHDLLDYYVWVHPNMNTKTMSLSCRDLIRFIEYCGNPYQII